MTTQTKADSESATAIATLPKFLTEQATALPSDCPVARLAKEFEAQVIEYNRVTALRDSELGDELANERAQHLHLRRMENLAETASFMIPRSKEGAIFMLGCVWNFIDDMTSIPGPNRILTNDEIKVRAEHALYGLAHFIAETDGSTSPFTAPERFMPSSHDPHQVPFKAVASKGGSH